MADPFTVSAILALAFQFANSEAGKAAISKISEVTTESVLKNLGKLRQMIWEKLQHQPAAAAALAEAETGSTEALKTIEPDLQIAMRDDLAFADEVRQLVQSINTSLKINDNSTMTQNNSGNAKGWQTKVEGGTAYIGEIHIHEKPSNP
jgi:cysteinyl-tRNA synthetase